MNLASRTPLQEILEAAALHSHLLHGTFLLCLASPAHLATLVLDTLRAGRAKNLQFNLVTDLVDLGIDGQDHGSQHAVTGKPVVQEVDEEEDLDDATKPRLNV